MAATFKRFGSPNPGSSAARNKGCICDVLANNHGVYPPIPASTLTGSRPNWYVQPGCRVHAQSARN